MHDPHPYKGTLLACLTCFRPKADKIHQSSINESTLESRIMPSCLTTKANPTDCNTRGHSTPIIPNHSHVCPVCLCESTHQNEDDILNCNLAHSTICQKCNKIPESDREYAEWSNHTGVYVGRQLDVEHTHTCRKCGESKPHKLDKCKLPELIICVSCSGKVCPGHKCPACHATWKHDYICATKQEGLCTKCASQNATDIFRIPNVEQIAQVSSEVLTGRERKEIELQQEVLCYNLCYDPVTHKLLDNWQELINEHKRNIKRLIERYRIGELTASASTMKFQREEFSTLSPEEIAQYKRNAKKGKQPKEPKDPKEPKNTQQVAKDAHAKLMADLCRQVRLRRPNLPEDEILKKAETQYQRQLKEESEMEGN